MFYIFSKANRKLVSYLMNEKQAQEACEKSVGGDWYYLTRNDASIWETAEIEALEKRYADWKASEATRKPVRRNRR